MNSNFQELKVRIENVEAEFVEHLRKKKTLSEEECQLMDDILETKEAILELLKEEKGAKPT
jgi:uncharacterized protein YfbU (UPF0304 family)